MLRSNASRTSRPPTAATGGWTRFTEAGHYRRFLDPVVSRFTDTLLAFPFLGPSLINATLAIGIAEVP